MNQYGSITESILSKFPELAADDFVFVPPPSLAIGDVAMRTFEAARKLKMPPPQLASKIASETAFGPEVVSVSTAGPYVNFRLDRSRFTSHVVADILREGAGFGSNRSGAGGKMLIEHTSINPNADPHLGRGRCAMIGDSLVRLFRFEGFDVEVHYYVNDIGRQIGLLVLACEGVEGLSFDQILKLYVDANARAESDPAFAAKGYELLAQMEQGDPETRKKFRAIVDLCLEGQLAVLGRLNISYDVFDYESRYLQDARIEPVLEALRQKDALFTDDDSRLVVDLQKLGYDKDEGRYFVLMRSNGSSMYGYRDLAYTIDKGAQGADINLIILGEDQKMYFQQIGMILGNAGIAVPDPVHYSYILLKEGKMSTRQGTVVLLSDFLDEAARRSLERVKEQCTQLSETEQQEIAAKVAVAAIRFGILRVGPNKNVIFDWESSLSFSGDTGPYVQYSCARINSILRKFGTVPATVSGVFPVESDAEWALVMKLALFEDVVAGAVRERNCGPIAQYALDTARLFTTFYHECPVLTADSQEQRTARAQLCAATRTTIKNALGLLGIEALERM